MRHVDKTTNTSTKTGKNVIQLHLVVADKYLSCENIIDLLAHYQFGALRSKTFFSSPFSGLSTHFKFSS